MTKKIDNNSSENKEYNPEKFSEPRTMPKGWDLSGLVNQSKNGKSDNHHNQKTDQTDTSIGFEEANWFADKFSEPRTTPRNWDVTSLK